MVFSPRSENRSAVKRRRKDHEADRARGHDSAPVVPPAAALRAPLSASELDGILDNVKATVLAVVASLHDKELALRQRLKTNATPGVKTGLSDIRLLRHWADRTLHTIEVLERGQQQGDLRTLVAELGEFRDILHAHDAELAAADDRDGTR